MIPIKQTSMMLKKFGKKLSEIYADRVPRSVVSMKVLIPVKSLPFPLCFLFSLSIPISAPKASDRMNFCNNDRGIILIEIKALWVI